jgi:two-component system response regulator HydG
MRAGASASLTHPIELRELQGAIDRAIQAREVERRRASSTMPPIPGASMAELERYAILETLKSVGGSTSKAAEMLGISVRTIQYRLHEYNMVPRTDVHGGSRKHARNNTNH